jgi:hypothetical protein
VINGVNPDANLADLIGRIDELLPWNRSARVA